jgi:hypothetical protein
MRFCPLTRLSQQANMEPSGVGQHKPSIPDDDDDGDVYLSRITTYGLQKTIFHTTNVSHQEGTNKELTIVVI